MIHFFQLIHIYGVDPIAELRLPGNSFARKKMIENTKTTIYYK